MEKTEAQIAHEKGLAKVEAAKKNSLIYIEKGSIDRIIPMFKITILGRFVILDMSYKRF